MKRDRSGRVALLGFVYAVSAGCASPAAHHESEIEAAKKRLKDDRVWFVPKVDAPPVIDGKVEEIWKKSKAHRFVWLNNKTYGAPKIVPKGRPEKPREPTDAYMLCDRENFYVAFVCYTPDVTKLRGAKKPVHDNLWWGADYVEVCLDPTHSRRKGHQFLVECTGLSFQDVIFDPDVAEYRRKGGRYGEYIPWDSKGVEYKTSVGEDAYYVEFKIPFKSIGLDPDNVPRIWGLSLIRFTPRPGRRKEENTAIGFTGKYVSFRPQAFGRAIIEVGKAAKSLPELRP